MSNDNLSIWSLLFKFCMFMKKMCPNVTMHVGNGHGLNCIQLFCIKQYVGFESSGFSVLYYPSLVCTSSAHLFADVPQPEDSEETFLVTETTSLLIIYISYKSHGSSELGVQISCP